MGEYQSYKQSGVEWIGDIPEHWVSSKLKFVLERIVTGGTPDTSNDSYWSDDEKDYSWISISDMTSNPNGIEGTKKKITQSGLDNKRLELLSIDTLIYSIYGSIGKVNRLKIESTIHQGILGLFPNSKIENRYLEYYLKYIQDFVNILSSSNTQENLNLDKVKNIGIVIPPLQEQHQIVQFLDEKTELIDRLISTKERKITLLKEQRTSLINQVVTKGLNPNVKMKDSGVEWIGEIPEHWDMKKVKYLFEIRKRISGELGYDILSVTQNGLKVKDIISGKGQLSMDYTKYQIVYPNDFVMNHMDLLTGYVDVSKWLGVTSPDYRVFTLIDPESLNEYYLRIFQFGYQNKVFYGFGQGSSMLGRWRLPSDEFNNFYFPYPSKDEQLQIVDFLDTRTKEIDDLVQLEQKKIDLLKEYRQSLISEVVTGKVKTF
jgi:type I restriction enzyme S subunit